MVVGSPWIALRPIRSLRSDVWQTARQLSRPMRGGRMHARLRLRRLRGWPLPLCAAALLLLPATTSAAPPPKCDTRVNDTPAELVECVNQADLMRHLQAFQDIADANPGIDGMPSRNSGEPGYKASVDYVAAAMRKAGYDVSIQTYKFDYYAYAGVPFLREVSPTAHDYVLGTDWGPGQTTGTTPSGLRSSRSAASSSHRPPCRARRAAARRPTLAAS